MSTPQERIDLAVTEIEGALAEMYPGLHVTRRMVAREHNWCIAIGAYSEAGWTATPGWMCDEFLGRMDRREIGRPLVQEG